MRQAIIFAILLGTVTARSVPARKVEQLEQQSIPIESIPVSSAQDSAALHSAKQYESSQTHRSQSNAPQLSFSWGRPASSGAGDALVTYNPVKYNMKLSRASTSGSSSGPVMQGAVQQVSRTVSYRTVAMPAASSRPAPTIEIPSNSNQVHLLFKSRSSPMYGTFSSAPGAAKPATSVYISTENHPSRFVPTQTSSSSGVREYSQYMRPVQYSTHVVMPPSASSGVVSTSSSGGRHGTPSSSTQRQVYQVSQVGQTSQVQGTQGGQSVQGYQIQPGTIYEVPTQVMAHTVQYVSAPTYTSGKGNSYKSAMDAARDILGEAHFNSLYGNQRQSSVGTSGTTYSSEPAVSKSTYTSSWSSSTGSLAPASVQQMFTRVPSIPVSAYQPQQKTRYITKVQSRVRPAPVHVIQAPKPAVAPSTVAIAQPTVSHVQPAVAVSYGQHQQQQQQQFSQQKEDQLQTVQQLAVPVQTSVNVQESAPAQESQFHAVQEQHFVPQTQPQTVSIQQAQPLVVPVIQTAPQTQPITYQVVPQTVSAVQTSQVQEAQTLAVPVQTVNVQESAPVQGSQFTAVQEQQYVPAQPQTVTIQQAQPITYQIVPQSSQVQEAQTLAVPAVQEQIEYVPSFQTRRTVQVRPLVQTTELITPQTAGSKVKVQASSIPSVPAPASVPSVVENAQTVVEYQNEPSQAVQGQFESTRVVQGFHQGRQFVPAEYEQQQQQQQQVSVQQDQPLEIQPVEAVETARPAVQQVQYQTVAQPVVVQKVQTKYVQTGGSQELSSSSGSTSYTSSQPGSVPVEIVQIQPEEGSQVEYAQAEAFVPEGAVQEGVIIESAQPAVAVDETPAVAQPAPVESTADLTYSSNSGAQEQSSTAESGQSSSAGVSSYGSQPQEQPQVQPDEQPQQQQYFTSADQQFQQAYAPYDDNYQPSR